MSVDIKTSERVMPDLDLFYKVKEIDMRPYNKFPGKMNINRLSLQDANKIPKVKITVSSPPKPQKYSPNGLKVLNINPNFGT